MKFSIFTGEKNHCILYGQVFVMYVPLIFPGFEIPDMDSERLMTAGDIVQYICDKEDIYDE